ncbi:S-norcoclaurine synthase [Heracleum sosnowskyi]|uniref:S-norcoclaurine synthase n=1 Tax=Heracleum sosnowskyi TaxID=360622 RepID=A0AAD8HHA2_9APIA|nr:S-norcoclaurine synthase [Heracleum sosnowskyi]
MFGTLSGEVEVNAPASAVWEVYGSLQLAAVVEKGFVDVVEKIEVAEGDGSVGTVLNLVFRPGVLPFASYKEKFITIDNEKRIKETLVVEGGYLEMGFDRYFVQLQIIEKDEKSCITKATIEYQLKEEYAANASLVSIDSLIAIMNIANSHVLAKTN